MSKAVTGQVLEALSALGRHVIELEGGYLEFEL